jgi:hypothetical protein
MERSILQNVSPEERLEQLKAVAEKTEVFTYPRELSMGELEELKNELSQNCITIDAEDEKKKEMMENYKAAVNPLKQQNRKILQMVRTGSEEVTDSVFLLKDLELEKMGYYNKEGVLVFERRLRPDEMQYSIQEHLRKSM